MTNQATFAVSGCTRVPGALFRLMVTLPVAGFGTELTTNTPGVGVCSWASTRACAVSPPGTGTVVDAAGNSIVTSPERENTAGPATCSAVAPAPLAWASTPVLPAPDSPGPPPAFSPRTPAAVALSVKPRTPSLVRANPLVAPLCPYTPLAVP